LLPNGSERYRFYNKEVNQPPVAFGIGWYRSLPAYLGEIMPTKTLPNIESEATQRPQVRSKQIGVRLTEDEYAEFEQLAWKSGRTIGDWARDRLVANAETHIDEFDHLMTEIVGLQLFLTEALSPVVCGQRMTSEQYDALLRNVKATILLLKLRMSRRS
jgi:hypothetical protein